MRGSGGGRWQDAAAPVPGEEGVVFAPSKVGVDRARVESFLRGERIYPLTMEIDLTQRCTRSCPSCPYGAARRPGLTLSLPFLDRLFAVLGPHTPGIVFSGGEPTSVEHFPEVVALARRRGFREIAVITNGSLLHERRVQDALLSGVDSVRVSLYDWQEGESTSFRETLRRIEDLRARVDREKSRLEVAAAMLTRGDWAARFDATGRAALAAGIHWLYFHPFCEQWESGRPVQADQRGVLEAVDALRITAARPGLVQVPYERYEGRQPVFSSLHSASFLIQIGADGVNYAGPECKYEPEYALLDLNEHLTDDFLWHPVRAARAAAMTSENYRPIGTRHRPPIFSAYLQQCLDRGLSGAAPTAAAPLTFRHPNII